MNKSAEVDSLRKKFDKQFPVSKDLHSCLKTVHGAYRLFQIHDGQTENDGHLEEGLYATLPIILHCVKDILAAGPKTSRKVHNVQQ